MNLPKSIMINFTFKITIMKTFFTVVLSLAVAFGALALILEIIPDRDRPNKEQKVDTDLLHNSPWDGSVYYVKEYLKDNLNDWDSYESLEWSNVQTTTDGGYMVRHKYRASNAFGTKIISNQLFYYTKSGVITSVVNI